MKQTYHTDIQLRYKMGLLSDELKKQIPSSTLCNWKQRDFSKIFSCETIYDDFENIEMIKAFLTKKRLLNAAKALYFVFTTLQILMSKIENRKQILSNSKEIIIKTIEKTKDTLGLKRVLNAFGINYQWFYRWKNKLICKTSTLKLCRNTHPHQLTINEINTIKKYLTDKALQNWSQCSVYYQMMRDKAAYMCISTFYKYSKLLGLKRNKPKHRRKKHKIGIRAAKPFEILHADATIFRPMDNSKVYVYLLADNFSRFILSWKASLEYSAKYTFENLKEAQQNYKITNILKKIDLIVDAGIENKAEVDDYIENKNIDKIIAQKDIVFSNSMIEAINKKLKYDYLFTVELQNFEQTHKYLEKSVNDYNNKPQLALCGLTPKEVFEGKMPDKHKFKQEIEIAKQQRTKFNKNNLCDNH